MSQAHCCAAPMSVLPITPCSSPDVYVAVVGVFVQGL